MRDRQLFIRAGKSTVTSLRFLTLLFSLSLHVGILGALVLFSADGRPETARVYNITLAQFAQADQPPAPEMPERVALPRRQAQPPPAPEPAAEPQEPASKVVSAIKPTLPIRARSTPKPAPPAAQPLAQPPQEPSADPVQADIAPRPRQFGGLSVYDQEQLDQWPSISRRVEPEYPARARRMKIEGTVVVELVVDTDGLPKACAIRSTEPPGYFEAAALNAAQKMRFIPGKINGNPVNTLVQLPFVFRLR